MTLVLKKLQIALADTYALYLKTQNYHWHVKGPQFKPLHELFETQYLELSTAPATFKELDQLKTLADGRSSISANDMVTELANDHLTLVKDLNQVLVIAQDNRDEGTVNLLSDRIEAHEKFAWMLNASREL
jgi:starvation-inducible DNA-binding protein